VFIVIGVLMIIGMAFLPFVTNKPVRIDTALLTKQRGPSEFEEDVSFVSNKSKSRYSENRYCALEH